jgi:hypothetical protein
MLNCLAVNKIRDNSRYDMESVHPLLWDASSILDTLDQ